MATLFHQQVGQVGGEAGEGNQAPGTMGGQPATHPAGNAPASPRMNPDLPDLPLTRKGGFPYTLPH